MHRRPKRRWLRFSLRGLLLAVALVAVGLATSVYTVRQRKAALALWEADREVQVVSEASVGRLRTHVMLPPEQTRLSPFRRWLGDEGVYTIGFPLDASDEELRRAAELFPEANVVRDATQYFEVPRPVPSR